MFDVEHLIYNQWCCNALISILLFLVALNILFEFLNDYVNMWCCYLIYNYYMIISDDFCDLRGFRRK